MRYGTYRYLRNREIRELPFRNTTARDERLVAGAGRGDGSRLLRHPVYRTVTSPGYLREQSVYKMHPVGVSLPYPL